MNYFIIVDEATGEWLPQTKGGFTGVEPTKAEPPRLYVDETSAKISLSIWKRGWLQQRVSKDYSYFGGDTEVWNETTKQPHRLKMKMAVIPVSVNRLHPHMVTHP